MYNFIKNRVKFLIFKCLEYGQARPIHIDHPVCIKNKVIFKFLIKQILSSDFSDENLGNFCSQESLNLAKASSPTSTHHLQIPPALVNQADSSIHYIQLTDGPALIGKKYAFKN